MSKKKTLEYIKKMSSNTPINESETPDIGPDLALNMFGKIYAGDPETGVVPGARPMNNDEKLRISYKILKDILRKNGHNPELADEWFLKHFGITY